MLARQTSANDQTERPDQPDPSEDGRLRQVAETIKREGIACIPVYFAESAVREASQQIDDALETSAGPSVLSNSDQGEILSRHFQSSDILEMCARICRYIDNGYDGSSDHKTVVRCLSTESPKKSFYYFHFDSYRLTIIAPIKMPSSEHRGDLLIFPNLRTIRENYLINVLQKAVNDSRWMQAFRKRQALRGGLATRVSMVPGNIYLIDGSQTLHANASIDPDQIRATLVFHFAETHRDHWIKTLRRRIRARS